LCSQEQGTGGGALGSAPYSFTEGKERKINIENAENKAKSCEMTKKREKEGRKGGTVPPGLVK